MMLLLVTAVLGPQRRAVAEPQPINEPPAPPPLPFPDEPLVKTEPVGYLPGSSHVTLQGDFAYEIPLEVPAGRAGMQPDMSLSYASSGGNGPAGVGWSLNAGLSEITRCNKTVASEGVADGVDFDATDVLCLDGNKLVLTGGVYGQDGSEYRTERDTFSKIVATGDQAGGPQHFRVWTKDLRILDYEAVSATRVEGLIPFPYSLAVQGSVRYRWILRDVHDRSGNAIRYHYSIEQEQSMPFSLEVRPSQIEYTRTDSGEAGRRSVLLEYEPRPDTGFWYESGVRTRSTQRLSRIRMFAPNPVTTEEVWSYALTYATSTTTGRSLLSSVTRFAKDGASLWARQFSWAAAERPSFDVIDAPSSAIPSPNDVALSSVLDVDGDGLDDLLYELGPGGGDVYPSIVLRTSAPGSPLAKERILGNSDPAVKGMLFGFTRPGDVDGDGAAELFLARTRYAPDDPPPGYRLLRFDPAAGSFDPVGPSYPTTPAGDGAYLLDLDGDGRLDLLRQTRDPDRWAIHANTGASHFGAGEDTGLSAPFGFKGRAIDLDGDGRTELLMPAHDGATGEYEAIGFDDDLHPVRAPKLDLLFERPFKLADLNGDGLRDLVLQGSGAVFEVRYNTGNGFGPTESVPVLSAPWPIDLGEPGLQIGDMDGDGREDLVAFSDYPLRRTTVSLSRGGALLALDLGVDPGHKSEADESGWTFPKLGDFNGDGLTDIVLLYRQTTRVSDTEESSSSWLRILQQRPGASDVIEAVSDEGAATPRETVTYERVRQTSAPPDCTYPARCIRHGLQVVREHTAARQGFPGAVRRHRYSYEAPRVDVRGRGFLGFARVRDFDEEAHRETVTEMDNVTESDGVYPYAGLPAKVTTIAPLLEEPVDPEGAPDLPPGGRATARVTQTITTYLTHWPSPHRHFVAPFASTTSEWEQDAIVTNGDVTLVAAPHPGLRSASSNAFYDDFGNLTLAWSTTLDGTHRSISNVYDNLEADWQIGLLRGRSVVAGIPGQLPPPRVTSFDYDDLGRLRKTTRAPDDPALWQATLYRLTGAGLVDAITRMGPGAPSQHVFFAYDDEGVFPRASWNDLAHYARVVHHPALGAEVLREDPNGVRIAATFDGFGRIRSQAPDDGMRVSWSYGQDDRASPGSPTGTYVHQKQQDGQEMWTWYDDAERAWEHDATGFDGSMIVRKRVFNRFGLPSVVRRPGFGEASAHATTTTFDTLGRPVHIVDPDGAATEIRYGLFETRRWDAAGHESYVHHDADGRVDETGHIVGGNTVRTTFTYGAFDQLEHVHDAEQNDTLLGYDEVGRRTSLVDLDLGPITYAYDGLDQIETETRAPVGGVPQVRTYGRDILGRTRTITTPDGLTTLRYDDGPNAKGKLTSVTSFDDVETAYAYNELGQPTITSWTLGGATYQIERSYDALGRLAFLLYPEAPGLAPRFSAGPTYNEHGYVSGAGEQQARQLPVPLWQVGGRNEDGQLTEATFWNGVTEKRKYQPTTGRPWVMSATGPDTHFLLGYAYDAVGNILSRTDVAAGRTETYAYDELDRLTDWTLDRNGTSHSTGYGYDRLGNIQDVTLDDVLQEHDDYGQGAGPHALTTRTVTGQPAAIYHYDARGRQDSGPGRMVHYSDFDLPRWIGTPAGEVTFLYDAFGARVSKTTGNAGPTITLADLYERRVTAAGVEHVFYIPGEGGPVAQVVYTEATGTKTVRAIHRDAQGSVALLSEKDGTAKERLFYDPFGLRVQADGAPEKDPFSVPLGFTGQRHDDDLGLIDMKGRMYDPASRRFLTADPLVPEPLFGQAYNRYSYVLNNPLRYTDPSGFMPDEWSSERTAARVQEMADNAADRPPPAEVLFKVKRRPGITMGPEGGGQPSASGESSDSEGHSAATGATAKPTTADRALDIGGRLLLRGARNTPVTGLVTRIAEAVYQHVTETKEAEPVTIGEIAALYVVEDGVGKPFGIIDGTAHDVATVRDDVNAIGEAHSPEDKLDAALDAAEKIARIATAAYGGAKGVQGMVQAAEEKPGGARGGTYKLRDPETGQVRRTGRTGDLARRRVEHARNPETSELRFEVDKTTDSYPAQRGREQRIYDQHPEADLNRARPIDPNNPRREDYLREGDKL